MKKLFALIILLSISACYDPTIDLYKVERDLGAYLDRSFVAHCYQVSKSRPDYKKCTDQLWYEWNKINNRKIFY